jgi:methyl-accepting chemotaxis protein
MQTAHESTIEDQFIDHFGMSSEQFRRELEADFEKATPEERAEFQQLVEQANAVLPEISATLDSIDRSLIKMNAAVAEMTEGMTSLDARVSRIEDNLASARRQRPAPSKERGQ